MAARFRLGAPLASTAAAGTPSVLETDHSLSLFEDPSDPSWALYVAASSQHTLDHWPQCILRNVNSCQASSCRFRKPQPQHKPFWMGYMSWNTTFLCDETFATAIAQALLSQISCTAQPMSMARGWCGVSLVMCTGTVEHSNITYPRCLDVSID